MRSLPKISILPTKTPPAPRLKTHLVRWVWRKARARGYGARPVAGASGTHLSHGEYPRRLTTTYTVVEAIIQL